MGKAWLNFMMVVILQRRIVTNMEITIDLETDKFQKACDAFMRGHHNLTINRAISLAKERKRELTDDHERVGAQEIILLLTQMLYEL